MTQSTTTYIGGHAFLVQFEYVPEIPASLNGPFEDEEINISKIHLGESEVNQLIIEEAPDLHDQIWAQVMTRLKEGDL